MFGLIQKVAIQWYRRRAASDRVTAGPNKFSAPACTPEALPSRAFGLAESLMLDRLPAFPQSALPKRSGILWRLCRSERGPLSCARAKYPQGFAGLVAGT